MNANSNSSSEFYYELTFNEVVNFYKARVLKIDENSRYLVTIHDVTEERQVIEVNNKLTRILEEAGEYSQFGSFEFNVNTQQVLWSDQLKNVLGVPADFNEDKLFEYYLSSIHPDDVPMMTSLIEMASSKNEDFDVEHRFRHFDGHYIWLRCAARCSTDTFSGHQLIQGISMDITPMKLAEEKEKRKHSLMEAVSILSLKLASDQELEATVNNMMQKIGETTGVSRVFLFKNGQHPVSGEPTVTQILEWTDAATPPQQGDPVLDDLNVSLLGFERWAEMLNAGVPVVGNVADFPGAEQAYLTDNGIKSVLVVPISLNGEWWGSLGFDECRHEREWTEDEVMLLTAVANLIGTVIERRKVHEKIAESEMRYRTAVETMTEGLIISDVNGVHRFANESAAKILDVPLEFLIGTGPELANENMRLLHPDGSDYDFAEYPCMVTLRKKEVIYDIVMGFAFTGQPVKWISINSCPLYSSDSKELTGVLMTFSDITERINYEVADEVESCAEGITPDGNSSPGEK
jgi:PAS domain S-box-containing protein